MRRRVPRRELAMQGSEGCPSSETRPLQNPYLRLDQYRHFSGVARYGRDRISTWTHTIFNPAIL